MESVLAEQVVLIPSMMLPGETDPRLWREDNPERWFKGLLDQYHGTYFGAMFVPEATKALGKNPEGNAA